MQVKALLLAAGMGTRLGALTSIWPKCLMPIHGRPLLEYWMSILFNLNLSDIAINVHHHADLVESFLSRQRLRGQVKIFREKFLLGTAGTLRANVDFFKSSITLLIHADNWVICNFEEFIAAHMYNRKSGILITMMTFSTDSPESCGIVEVKDNVVVNMYEKSSLNKGSIANSAIYLIEPIVLDWLKANPLISDFSTEVLPNFFSHTAVWHNNGIQRDIGTIESLRLAQLDPDPLLNIGGEDEWLNQFKNHPIHESISQGYKYEKK